MTRAAQARAARGEIEEALDLIGWRWSARLSLWLDALLVIEAGGR
jgi:hypothetical protein